MDELRDYRFYAADMLHPSEVAVDYIWQKFSETLFGRNNSYKEAIRTTDCRQGTSSIASRFR